MLICAVPRKPKQIIKKTKTKKKKKTLSNESLEDWKKKNLLLTTHGKEIYIKKKSTIE